MPFSSNQEFNQTSNQKVPRKRFQNQPQTPFNESDLIIPLLEAEDDFVSTRKKSFTALYQHFYKFNQSKNQITNSSIFMTINQFFHKFTLAAVSLSLLMVLAFSTVTAQAFAPDEYKPSTIVSNLFAANKQPDKDPQTQLAPNSILAKTDPSLSPDDNNYVANLPACDLAVKAPKTSKGLKSEFRIGSKRGNDKFSGLFALPKEDTLGSFAGARYEVTCRSIKNPEGTTLADDYGVGVPERGMKKITKDELQQKTGWFVTAANISNIYFKETNETELFKNDPNNKEFYNNASLLEKKYGKKVDAIYYFVYNDMEYAVEFSGFSDIMKPEGMQLQFNSLVKNIFSPELLAADENVVKDCTTLFAVKATLSVTKESFGQSESGCGISIQTDLLNIALGVDYVTKDGKPSRDITAYGGEMKNIKISDLPKILDTELVNKIDPKKVYLTDSMGYWFMDINNNMYILQIFNFDESISSDQIKINYIK